MNKFKYISLIGVILIMLTGCINIPIGDGAKIKIGKDGFTITDDEGEKHKVELSEDEVVVTDEKTGEKKMEMSEEGMKYTDENGEEQEIKYEEKDGHVSVKGSGSDGEELSMQVGENIDIPEEFPSDIPLANDAEIIMAMKQEEGLVVGYVSNEEKDKLIKMYDEFVAKQTVEAEPETNVMEEAEIYMKMYHFEREDGEITINVSKTEDQVEVGIIFEEN